MIKICIGGSKGKMGSRILALAKDETDLSVAGEFDIGGDPETCIKDCDCLIDFTTPDAAIEHLAICEKYKKAMVIGTTGFEHSHAAKIREASKNIPVVFSPNMSIGVNVLFKMVGDAAKILGSEYDIQILEAHHVHKKDSPSGTAKELSRIIKEAKPHADVPIESVREDEIVGEHTVTFEGPYDTVELTHSAKTRDIFAKGALAAAKFVSTKPAGIYTMKDVLGI